MPVDPTTLKQSIDFCLRHLVREPAHQHLYDLLTAKFHRGVEHRVTFKVNDLITEAEKAGIPPPTFEPNDLDPIVSGAIFILQHCELGLPADVLAAGLACTIEKLNGSLIQYVGRRVVDQEHGLWTVPRLKARLVQQNSSQLLGCTLRHLLEFIQSNKQTPEGWGQVQNAIALDKISPSSNEDIELALLPPTTLSSPQATSALD
jgi:hypothetical protein